MSSKKSIVIIGNGPSVLTRNLKSQIDAHDIVIRINGFKLDDFEKHIGSKTDIWVNGTLNWENIKYEKQYNEVWLLYPLLQYYFQRIKKLCLIPIRKYGLNVEQVKKLFVPNQTFMEYCYRASGYPIQTDDRLHPSTGLFAIYLAINKFKDISSHINIVGFDCFKDAVFCQPTPHYFESNQADVMSPFTNAHLYDIESKTIKALIKDKKLKEL